MLSPRRKAIILVTATIFLCSFVYIIVDKDSNEQILNEKEDIFEHKQSAAWKPNGSSLEEDKNEATKSHKAEEIDTQIPIPATKEAVYLPNNLWVPAGWSGIPLSLDNPLYKDPASAEVIEGRTELANKLISFSKADWVLSKEWPSLLYKYEVIIGWNGIFDAVDEAQKTLDIDISSRLHNLGEVLAQSKLVTNNRYVTEITSRDILHRAPMHGGVWYIMKGLLDDYTATANISTLFQKIDEELCFFKNETNMAYAWISCIHGVGHGLGNYYGVDNITLALDVCAANEDEQYQYACATGIFMTLDSNYSTKTFSPCDSSRFAPACFRFKRRLLSYYFYNTSDPCSSQPSPYHRRACIWGFAFIKKDVTIFDAHDYCEVYRPNSPSDQPQANDYAACYDGFFGSHELVHIPEERRGIFCYPLAPYETAFSICNYYSKTSIRQLTFSGNETEETEDSFFYNYSLLEELFDPSVLGKSAEWLSEWDLIIPKIPNNLLVGASQPPKNNRLHHGGSHNNQ